jgi:Gpi18-like mannosyltransferase
MTSRDGLHKPPDTGSSRTTTRARSALIITGLISMGLAVRLPFWFGRGQMDMLYFASWADQMHRGSLANAYKPNPALGSALMPSNYPPGYLYILAGSIDAFSWLTGQQVNAGTLMRIMARPQERMSQYYYFFFKAPAVLADVATGVLLYLVLRRRVGTVWAAVVGALFLIQPGVIYNSARWGQVDALHTLLMVASLELTLRRRYVLMSLLATLALLIKLQAIILAPIWLLCLLLGGNRSGDGGPLPRLTDRLRQALTFRRTGRILVSVLLAAAVAAGACAPFVTAGAGKEMWNAYTGAVGQYPVATANAFSLWGVFFPLADADPANWVKDTTTFAGISLHAIGMLLLVVATAYVFLRLVRNPDDPAAIRWSAVALCAIFFTFPTQIHERYLHPLIAVMAWAFVRRWWWWLLWLGFSSVYAMNLVWFLPLERGWRGANYINPLAWRQFGGWYPSQAWGAVITLLTVIVLVMPLRAWRNRERAATQPLDGAELQVSSA